MAKYRMNELELLMACSKKALENAHGGIKTAGGSKMSYKKASELIIRLEMQYMLEGCYSRGICKDCINFNQSGIQSLGNAGGRCKYRTNHTTVYETCARWEEK